MTEETGSPLRPRRSLILNLAVLTASAAATLAIAEFIVRMTPPSPHYRPETAYFDTINMPMNSLGYHDYEYDREKKAGTFRIMVVGDSFSKGEGLGFDDVYPKRLERYLNCYGNAQGICYQVMNMSMHGRSTPEEVRLLKEYAGQYHPDVIILSYCLNDAEDLDTLDELWRLRGIHPALLFEKPRGWRGFLYDHSTLSRLVIRRVFNTKNNRCYKKYFKAIYKDDYQGWKKTREALTELGAFSRSSGIPARVILFPLFSFSFGDEYPFSHIHNKVHRAVEEAGLPYIDLLANYRNMNRIRLEYIPDRDPHPDEIAHRIAAEALWRDLKQSGLLPGDALTGKKCVFPRRCVRFVAD